MSRKLPFLLICACLFTTTQAQEEMPKPTKQHEILKKDVGVWDVEIEMWLAGPGQPSTKSKGVDTTTLMGGFWSISHMKYEYMGKQVAGHGLIGYDPIKKKYIGTWHESTSPFRATMEGTYDEKNNKMTYQVTGMAMDGSGEATYIIAMTYTDPKSKIFEMSMPIPGSDKAVKIMQMTYKKR